MNRKERRVGQKGTSDPGKPRPLGQAERHPAAAWTFATALEHHRAGRPLEAEGLCQQVLAAHPQHLGCLHLLGLIARQAGRADIALSLFRRALSIDSRVPEFHLEMGLALRMLGRLQDATSHYKRAATLNPQFMEAQYNLANVLREQGKLDQAIERYGKALALYPTGAEIHNNFGSALMAKGDLAGAAECFKQAIALRPVLIEAYNNLCTVLLTLGEVDQALVTIRRALDIAETHETRALFVHCARRIRSVTHSHDLPDLVCRALSERWGRPRDLAGFAIALLKVDPALNACTTRAGNAWPTRLAAEAIGHKHELADVYGSNLFRLLLEMAPVCDIALERLLTSLRKVLLEAAVDSTAEIDEPAFDFYCALARQCFVNEYVFDADIGELTLAGRLREKIAAALATHASIPPLWLIAVASYFPLSSILMSDALLKNASPDALKRLLVQQIEEPQEEEQCRSSIPQLTTVDHPISLLVKHQYEESPYPRWVAAADVGQAIKIEPYLRQRFPFAKLPEQPARAGIDILVAGCGTGLQAVETAQQYDESHVLAIDLSLISLGYASRKTREIGLRNVKYAQADLLAMPSLERSFDVIEATGVLHHLAEPEAGWRALLAQLRPGGFMHLGLYSARARGDIAAARRFLAGRRLDGNLEALRRSRQELMALAADEPARGVAERADFYSMSECRDLLFHVQEVCFDLPRIKTFLAQSRLYFIGFEIAPHVLQQFSDRFGADASPADLDLWHVFENDNPETFRGMYQFWIRKP